MRPRTRLTACSIAACAVGGLALTALTPGADLIGDWLRFVTGWTGNTVLVGCLSGPFLFGRSGPHAYRSGFRNHRPSSPRRLAS